MREIYLYIVAATLILGFLMPQSGKKEAKRPTFAGLVVPIKTSIAIYPLGLKCAVTG